MYFLMKMCFLCASSLKNIMVFSLLLLSFVSALCNQVLAKVSPPAFIPMNAFVWIQHRLLIDAG